MDRLSAFVFDNSTHDVFIMRDDNDRPLFKASDVGKVLGIKNIHTSIIDFDEDEKSLRTTYTLGGEKDTTFLTKQGVLKLIMRSRKPIAIISMNWEENILARVLIAKLKHVSLWDHSLTRMGKLVPVE